MLSEETIQGFRVKELMMFLIGYAISELRNSCVSENKKISMGKPLGRLIDELIEHINIQKKLVTKRTIIDIVVATLNVLK